MNAPTQHPSSPCEAHPPICVYAPPTSVRATAALVLGICGLLFPFVPSIAALVLGRQAAREIDAAAGRVGGRGSATAGTILGWVGIAMWVLVVVWFVVVALWFDHAFATLDGGDLGAA